MYECWVITFATEGFFDFTKEFKVSFDYDKAVEEAKRWFIEKCN